MVDRGRQGETRVCLKLFCWSKKGKKEKRENKGKEAWRRTKEGRRVQRHAPKPLPLSSMFFVILLFSDFFCILVIYLLYFFHFRIFCIFVMHFRICCTYKNKLCKNWFFVKWIKIGPNRKNS